MIKRPEVENLFNKIAKDMKMDGWTLRWREHDAYCWISDKQIDICPMESVEASQQMLLHEIAHIARPRHTKKFFGRVRFLVRKYLNQDLDRHQKEMERIYCHDEIWRRMPTRMKCLICKKECHEEEAHEFGDGTIHHEAKDAIICRSYGNWGSSVYDPIAHDSEYLQFMVCDDCLSENGEHVRRVKYTQKTTVVDEESFFEYQDHNLRELLKRHREKHPEDDHKPAREIYEKYGINKVEVDKHTVR
jgi:hypothetical protein